MVALATNTSAKKSKADTRDQLNANVAGSSGYNELHLSGIAEFIHKQYTDVEAYYILVQQ